MDVVVRLATIEDAVALSPFAARVFFATFGAENDPALMAAYIAEAFAVSRLASEIGDRENRFFLAEIAGELAGYAKVAFASDETPECVVGPEPIAELERLYVGQEWHGKGVANHLMAACLDEARRCGFQTIWLGVFEQNVRARRFYAKCGFHDVGTHVFLLGSEAQTDRVMTRSVSHAPKVE